MNRRTFLKSLAIACGAAVVCPGELLKEPVTHITPIIGIIGVGERSKHIVMGITNAQLQELVQATLKDLSKIKI